MIYSGKAITVQASDDGIAELCFDLQDESVNKFNALTLNELKEATAAIAADTSLKGVIVTSGKPVFIVGADITEFGAQFGGSEVEVADKILKINFDVFNAFVPVLVDFWATWCAPCKAIAPVLEQLAGEYDGKVRIGKVNVDENPAIPGQYGVRGIPTLILFKDGQIVDQLVGAVPKNQLESLLQKAL